MLEYNLPFPDVTRRKMIQPFLLRRGDVVAFKSRDQRTGIIVMEYPNMMMVAVNLYEEEGRLWYSDLLPKDLFLFEASEEEKLWGYQFFLDLESAFNDSYYKNRFISFIDVESPKEDQDYGGVFCMELLSRAHKMLDIQQQQVLKKELGEVIMQSRGLQFNRIRMEYYCFLMGVLMIAEHSEKEFVDARISVYQRNWRHFSWMYGMVIGRVIGSRLHNFTAVVNQVGQSPRDCYLHLYLPLVENNICTICLYTDDNRERLKNAIEKMRGKESLIQQSTDLDELYGFLFPKHFKDAMSSQRPAATIAELKKEIAAKDEKIFDLETSVNNLKKQYEEMVSKLTDAVSDVEKDIITPTNLKDAFLRFDSGMAHTLFASVATVLAQNPIWQKYSPLIQQAIFEKQEMEKRGEMIKQEIVLFKQVDNEVGNVAPGATGIIINKDKK